MKRHFFPKGSAAPKSTAASPSKGSIFVDFLLDQLRNQSPKGRYDRDLRKRVLLLKCFMKSMSAEGNSFAKGFAYPRCIDTSCLQGVKCEKCDDQSNLVEKQLSSIPVVSDGKIVAFDWHQVTDT